MRLPFAKRTSAFESDASTAFNASEKTGSSRCLSFLNASTQNFAFSIHSRAWRSPAERTTQRTFGFSMQSKTASAAVANNLPVCRDHMPILKREPSRTHRC